jgi:hypothetical protein
VKSPGFWPGLFLSDLIVMDWGELPRNAYVIDGYRVRRFRGLTRDFVGKFANLFCKHMIMLCLVGKNTEVSPLPAPETVQRPDLSPYTNLLGSSEVRSRLQRKSDRGPVAHRRPGSAKTTLI